MTAPAWAGRTLVLQRTAKDNCTDPLVAIDGENLRRRVAFLRTLGVDVDLRPMNALKTEWLRLLTLPDPAGAAPGSVTHVAGIDLEFTSSTGVEATTCGSVSGSAPCYPCSLNQQTKWPANGPWVMWASQSHSSTGIFQQTASCSTGFAANSAPSAATQFRSHIYAPGSSYVAGWSAFHNASRFTRLAANPPAAGVWRVLLRESRNGWNPYAEQSIAPANWDSLPDGAQTSDTVAAVARYKRNGIGYPIIYGASGVGGYLISQYGTMLTTLALADSACGRQMLGQTASLPVRFALQVGPLGATGKFDRFPDSGGLDEGPGPYPGDSVYVKASLQSFHAMRLKGTVLMQTNADTMSALATQYEWVRNLWPEAHVSPYDKAGVWTTAQGGTQGNATVTKTSDVWGATRDRQLFPTGETDPRNGCDCSTDTSSIYCWLTRQFRTLERYYGKARVDHVIAAPLEDWTPTYFTRTRGSLDSLKWCAWLAGVRGFRVGVMSLTNDVGTASGGTGPRGYSSGGGVESVIDPATGYQVGTIAMIPSRDWDLQPNAALPNHDIVSEFLDGLFVGDWYTGNRSAQYSNGHNFFARTAILEIPGNSLGGAGTALTNWRQGYWYARGLWAMCNSANRFGRKIIEPSYGDETAAWFMQIQGK